MMKFKLEVQQRPESETRIALKPLECGLSGVLVYDVPQRASAQLRPGAVVEAIVDLPHQWPIREAVATARLDGWKSAGAPPDSARYVLLTKRISRSHQLPVPSIARYLPGEGIWCSIQDQIPLAVDCDWVWHEMPEAVAA